jgi:hypothetical protein
MANTAIATAFTLHKPLQSFCFAQTFWSRLDSDGRLRAFEGMWMLTTAAERDDISEDLRHFFLEPLLRVSTHCCLLLALLLIVLLLAVLALLRSTALAADANAVASRVKGSSLCCRCLCCCQCSCCCIVDTSAVTSCTRLVLLVTAQLLTLVLPHLLADSCVVTSAMHHCALMWTNLYY